MLNGVFEKLKLMCSYDFEIKNFRVNLFIELFGYLFNFTLTIPEIISSASKEDLSMIRFLKLNNSSVKLNTLKMPKSTPSGYSTVKSMNNLYMSKTLSLEVINKYMRTIEKQTDFLLRDFSLEIVVEASDFRFYKPEINIMRKIKESRLREFNNSNCNSKVTVTINKIILSYSQRAIINLLLFCNCFDSYKKLRKDKRDKALNKFRSFISNSLSEFKGKKQISWVNEKLLPKAHDDIKAIYLIYYTFLVMIKKEYIKYNISKYLVIGLIRNYRNIVGREYAIIDYLIDSNINIFLNAPTINNIGSMFMSINEIEKHINRAENKKLRDFIFQILKEYSIGILIIYLVRANIEKYNSYDDYLCINLKIAKIKIILEKSNEVTENNNVANKDELWEIVYFKNNKLDNRKNDITFEYNSQLVIIEVKNIELNFITNTKENIFLEYFHESLQVLDIGYKTILENEGKSENDIKSLPLLNMRYKFRLEFEKTNNYINISIDIPCLYICLDPITLYLISTI